MNCSKCGAELRPAQKFCSKCGTQISNMTPVPVNAEMVGRTVSASSPVNAGIVRNKAVWDMAPGVIARRVSEREFRQLDRFGGVLIQECVTAVIYVDGRMMGMIQGGDYEFDRLQEKTIGIPVSVEETPEETMADKVTQTVNRVFRFLSGKSKSENEEKYRQRVERAGQNTRRINQANDIRIALISNTAFELMFGSNREGEDFAPMTISSKIVDVQMGVSLQMQVNAINDFVLNYLADKERVSVADVQQMLQPTIESLLRRVLRNLDYQEDGLPAELVDIIKSQIQKVVNEQVRGIEVIQVLDITDKSADFERFRAAERELMVSEKELGFMQRAGEFRNRMAEAATDQEIQTAKNAEELRQALGNINKDGLLHDSEIAEFVEMLESQKRLRQANTEEQEHEALMELRKSRLVKDDDVEVLENMLKNKQLERDEITELLRLRTFQSTQEARLRAETALSDMELKRRFSEEAQTQEHNQASALSAARHRSEMTDLEIQSRRKEDEYTREQSQLDYEQSRRRQQDDYEYNRRLAQDEREMDERKTEFDYIQTQRRAQDDEAMRRQKTDYDYEHNRRLAQDEQEISERKSTFEYDQRQRRMQDDLNLHQQKTKFDYEYERQRAQDELEREEQKTAADWQRSRIDKQEDMSLLERKAAIARSNMAMMQEHDLKMEQMARENEALRIRTEATMTQEQIAAAHMGDMANLDAAAQAEMAKMMGSGRAKEAEMLREQQEHERRMYEQMMAMQAQNAQGQQQAAQMTQQQMLQMMQMMQAGMVQMGQANLANQQNQFAQMQDMQQQRYNDQVQMKQEYREDAIRQQSRTDHTQDSALNYTTRVTESAMGNGIPSQSVPVPQTVFCSSCGGRTTSDRSNCPHCGEPLD